MTTETLASKLGITTKRVWQIARNRGIEPIERGGFGEPAKWPRSAVKAMKRRPPGRPKIIREGKPSAK